MGLPEWISRQLKGYLRVKLTGYSPERFLNLCNARGIVLWDLTYQDDGYVFWMTLGGFLRIRPLVRKSQVRLRILERDGLPFFLRRNKKRVGFAAGALVCTVSLYLLSLFIWDIQIEGNRRYTDEMIVNYLQSSEITWGMPKARVDCEKLEAALRDDFPEVTWAAARVSGTRLLIAVKENEVLSAIPEKDETPCNLVASRPGVIAEITVRQGRAQVKAGESVEEGQVLVSGVLPITDDSEAIKNIRYVHADADITAFTQYPFSESFPRTYLAQAETGRKKLGLFLQVGQWSGAFLFPAKEGEHWVYMTERNQLRLFSSFYLPLYWGKIQGRQVQYYDAFYSKKELECVAEGIYQNFVKNLSEKGVQIIQNDVKILEGESVCKMEGMIFARESIGQVQQITNLEEKKDKVWKETSKSTWMTQ